MEVRVESVESLLRNQRASLADFGLFAFRCDDLDALLHRACELVSDAMDVDLVKVLEHLPSKKQMLIRSGVHWDPGVVGEVAMSDDEGSPGGYALKRDEPVISQDVDAETRFAIPDVLRDHGVRSMVNVIIAGDHEPFGVLEVDARDRRDFGSDDILFLRTYANLLAAAIERIEANRRLQEAADEQRTLAQEFAHRVKNVLTLVRSLASMTSIRDRTAEEYRDAFIGRLDAFAASENLVLEQAERSLGLAKVAEIVLAPYGARDGTRIRIGGPELQLPARNGRMLALAFHELATNAAKYGALSVPDGRVEIRWEVREDGGGEEVRLDWQECDGPEVTMPDRQGFGGRLLERVVPYELEGTAELAHRHDGLLYTLIFPLGRGGS